MNMRRILTVVFILPILAYAVEVHDVREMPETTLIEPERRSETDQVCPNPNKIGDICNSIGSRVEDNNPDSYYVYDYQRRILEASCADSDFAAMYEALEQGRKDDEIAFEAEVVRKVNIMWDRYEKDFTATTLNFLCKTAVY